MHFLFIRIIRLLNTLKAEIFNSVFRECFTVIGHGFKPNKSGLFEVSSPFIFHEEVI